MRQLRVRAYVQNHIFRSVIACHEGATTHYKPLRDKKNTAQHARVDVEQLTPSLQHTSYLHSGRTQQ